MCIRRDRWPTVRTHSCPRNNITLCYYNDTWCVRLLTNEQLWILKMAMAPALAMYRCSWQADLYKAGNLHGLVRLLQVIDFLIRQRDLQGTYQTMEGLI